MDAAIATFSLVAFDCPNGLELASFYEKLTGWPIGEDSEPGWAELVSPTGATIAFQGVDDYRPPQWPAAEHPQQAHMDFNVADLDAGERAVLAIGARKHDLQPGETWRVYLDPVGHPFCLVLDPAYR
jgi:predicted enzyme related to lactoylglutathione lyase